MLLAAVDSLTGRDSDGEWVTVLAGEPAGVGDVGDLVVLLGLGQVGDDGLGAVGDGGVVGLVPVPGFVLFFEVLLDGLDELGGVAGTGLAGGGFDALAGARVDLVLDEAGGAGG